MKNLLLIFALSLLITNASIAQEEKNYQLKTFDDIEISGAYKVFLKQSSSYSLKIEADEDDFEYIEVKQNGNKLIISFKENKNIDLDDITLWISSPKLINLEINGAVDLECENTWNLQKFDVEINGASKMEWNINCQSLNMYLNGASSVEIEGNAQKANIEISGAGSLDAIDFITNDFNIEISGAGNANVYAKQSLKASISGIGIVKYYGNPQNVNSNISLLGVLENADE